jgi:hypothetical protein
MSIVASGRRLIATSFLDEAYISDRTVVKDSTGGTKQTWIERPDPVLSRFVALSDDIAEQANGTEFGQATAMWLAPLGTDAAEGDKIRNPIDGGMWIVTRDITPPSNLAISVRLGIREV